MTAQSAVINSLVVIDDDAVDQLLHKRAIDQFGLVTELTVFESAETALQYFRERPSISVDIILLDVNMPLMNGFEFLEAMVSEFDYPIARFVVVMLSSLDTKSRNKASKFQLVRSFVEKPLRLAHLEDMSNMLGSDVSPHQKPEVPL